MSRTLNRIPKKQSTEKTIINEDGTYDIYIINDTHIGRGGEIGYKLNAVDEFAKVVNVDNPDMVIHLGDIIDTTNEMPKFLESWSKINGVFKTAVPGNHELDSIGIEEVYEYLDHHGKEINAGSKFNQTYVLNLYDFKVRVITLDSCFDENDLHHDTWNRQRHHSGTPNYLDGVLQGSDEDYILIFTHALPHYSKMGTGAYYADEDLADTLAQIVNNNLSSNQKLYWFGGHYHQQEKPVKLDNLGSNNIGYQCPTARENLDSRFTKLKVKKDGIEIKMVELPEYEE